MAVFQVTDPQSGRSLRLTGDSAPTEQELNDIFAQTSQQQPQAIAQPGLDTQQPQVQPQQDRPGIFSRALGAAGELITGRERETERTRAAPELGTVFSRIIEKQALEPRRTFAPQEIQGFAERVKREGVPIESLEAIEKSISPEALKKISSALLITTNPAEQIKIIKTNIPQAKFDIDEKGNTIVNIAGIELPLNKPGFSQQEFGQLVAGAAAFTPSGKIATLAKTGLKKLFAAGVSAAGTQAAIEEIQEDLGGDFDSSDVIVAGIGAGFIQGLTSAGQNIFNRFINARQGKFATDEIGELIKTSEREGVEVFVSDASRSKFVKLIDTFSEKIPFIGAVPGRIRQSRQQLQAARNLQQSITKEIDDTAAVAQKGLSEELKKNKTEVFKLFAEASQEIDPAGNIPRPTFSNAIDQEIAEESKRVLPNQKLIDMLEKFKVTREVPFSETRPIITELNENISEFFSGNRELIGGRGVSRLIRAKRAIERDIDKFVENTGTQKGKQIFDKAKERFIEFEVPFIEGKGLSKIVKSEEPEDVFNFLFSKAGKRKGIKSRAEKVFKLMDQKGREAVKSEIVNRAIEDSLQQIGPEEVLSAAKFASNLEKFDKINQVFFNPSDKKRIDGVIKLFRNTQRAAQISTAPPTGEQIFIPLGIGSIAGISSNAVIPLALGLAGTTRLMFQSKAGRNLLLGLGKTTEGTKAFNRKLDQINSFLQKTAVPQLSQ